MGYPLKALEAIMRAAESPQMYIGLELRALLDFVLETFSGEEELKEKGTYFSCNFIFLFAENDWDIHDCQSVVEGHYSTRKLFVDHTHKYVSASYTKALASVDIWLITPVAWVY